MKIVRRGLLSTFAAFSVLLTFLPESFFKNICFIKKEILDSSKFLNWLDVDSCNVTISRLFFFALLFILMLMGSWLYSCFRSVKIEGNNYTIVVEYGNLLKKKKCQRLINFDECYTTKVGTGTAEIKENTLCGQYLLRNPNLDVHALIAASGVKPCRRKSKYNDLVCYEPGTIVANGDDLLMAFARLESSGKSMKFTVEEYLRCLELLWKEMDDNFCSKDVCIPALGSGIARFDNGVSQSVTKQELVDLIISSYKLSPYKLKNNNALHIVCRKSDDFSIDKVS